MLVLTKRYSKNLKHLTRPITDNIRVTPVLTEEALRCAQETVAECERLYNKIQTLLKSPLLELDELSRTASTGTVGAEQLNCLQMLKIELSRTENTFQALKKDISIHILFATTRLGSLKMPARLKHSPFASLTSDQRLELFACLWQDKKTRGGWGAGGRSEIGVAKAVSISPLMMYDTPMMQQMDAFDFLPNSSASALEENSARSESQKRDSIQSESSEVEGKANITVSHTPSSDNPNELSCYESTYNLSFEAKKRSSRIFQRFSSLSSTTAAWQVEAPRMVAMRHIPSTKLAEIDHQISMLRVNHNLRQGSSKGISFTFEHRRLEMNLLKEQINARIYWALTYSSQVALPDRPKQARALREALSLHKILANLQVETARDLAPITKMKRRSAVLSPEQALAQVIDQDANVARSSRVPYLLKALEKILTAHEVEDSATLYSPTASDGVVQVEEGLAVRNWLSSLAEQTAAADMSMLKSQQLVTKAMESWADVEDGSNAEKRTDCTISSKTPGNIFFQAPAGWKEQSVRQLLGRTGYEKEADPMQDYEGGFAGIRVQGY